jgi:hypothetical protein
VVCAAQLTQSSATVLVVIGAALSLFVLVRRPHPPPERSREVGSVRRRSKLSGRLQPPSRMIPRWLEGRALPAIFRRSDGRFATEAGESAVVTSTWIGYVTHCRLHIAPFLGRAAIGTLTTRRIKRWLGELVVAGRSSAMRARLSSVCGRSSPGRRARAT